MIDADQVAEIPNMLELGCVMNTSVTEGQCANDDQRLAALEDCCRRLGVPMDRQTALAYALGVRQALDRFDHLISDDNDDMARELELYGRVALLYDRESGRDHGSADRRRWPPLPPIPGPEAG